MQQRRSSPKSPLEEESEEEEEADEERSSLAKMASPHSLSRMAAVLPGTWIVSFCLEWEVN